MTFKLSIECDNSAFSEGGTDVPDPGPEIASILRKLARKVEFDMDREDGETFRLMDSNGNKVGTAELVID